jgi:hypothetical protein
MTRISLQVPAREVMVGDRLTRVDVYGIVTDTATSPGAVYLWLNHADPRATADVILNHGDPCRITRERVEDTPKDSRWEIVGPDDASLVDIYDRSAVGTSRPVGVMAVSQDEIRDLIDQLTDALPEGMQTINFATEVELRRNNQRGMALGAIAHRGGERHGLTDVEICVLVIASQRDYPAGHTESRVHTTLGVGLTRHAQVLNGLLDDPRALAFDALLVNRLRRIRDDRMERKGR